MKTASRSELLAAIMLYASFLEKSYSQTGFSSLWHAEVSPKNKYFQILTVSNGSRSSHSWIDMDGLIWKSASYKSPEKNFPRGSVFHPDKKGEWRGITWAGVTGGRWDAERNKYADDKS